MEPVVIPPEEEATAVSDLERRREVLEALDQELIERRDQHLCRLQFTLDEIAALIREHDRRQTSNAAALMVLSAIDTLFHVADIVRDGYLPTHTGVEVACHRLIAWYLTVFPHLFRRSHISTMISLASNPNQILFRELVLPSILLHLDDKNDRAMLRSTESSSAPLAESVLVQRIQQSIVSYAGRNRDPTMGSNWDHLMAQEIFERHPDPWPRECNPDDETDEARFGLTYERQKWSDWQKNMNFTKDWMEVYLAYDDAICGVHYVEVDEVDAWKTLSELNHILRQHRQPAVVIPQMQPARN